MSEKDQEIIEMFRKMSNEDIIDAILSDGGLISHTCFRNTQPGYIAATRDDGWCLEVRCAGPNQGNDVWIKSRTKLNSGIEKEGVLLWLQRLGFNELEADIYYASNTPHKRHIAREVGRALQEVKTFGRVHSPIGRTTSKAVTELRADVDRMISLVNKHATGARVMELAVQ